MMVEGTARNWNESYTFPAVTNGWLRRARVFVDMPAGISGLHMNLEAPIFQNKDFRIAMQHLFNFDRLNRNLMYNEYFRKTSFFQGTEYANPDRQELRVQLGEGARASRTRGLPSARRQNQSAWAKLRNVAYGLHVHPLGHRRHPRQR